MSITLKGKQITKSVVKYASKEAKRYMDKYVPMRDGHLRTTVTVGDDYVEYTSPYAHYQYHGVLYVDPITGKGSFYNENYGHWSRPDTEKVVTEIPLNYHTAGTGSHWDDRMMSAEGSKFIKQIQEYVRRK